LYRKPDNMMLRALLAAALLALGGPPAAWSRDLTVGLPAGGPVQALRHVYLTPFAATGAKLDVLTRPTGAQALRADTAAAWDVVQLSGAELPPVCQAGVLEKLDWPALGGRDRMVPPGATDCGLGIFVQATVLAWDHAKFQGTPTWRDFWDIAKLPGKRGLRRSPRGTLEIALLADDVAPGEVYRTLRSDDGVDRAFRRLDQLAPYLVWWTPGARDGLHLLSSGEALMTSAASPSIVLANRGGGRSFGMQWAGGLVEAEYWAIVKGGPNLAEAQRLLAFAADPKVQAKLPEAGGLGPLAKGANDGLPPDLLAASPAAGPGTLWVDEAFWRENGEKLQARFDAWLPH
jgi:putative spermidine/putrescine transport system substrate-binding protein